MTSTIDRLNARYWKEIEQEATLIQLKRMAIIDEAIMECLKQLYDRLQEMTRGQVVYGQVKLSPDAALMKRQAMSGGQNAIPMG